MEYEYNPQAWDALNSKLNALPKGGHSPLKWYVAASITTGLLVGAYFYFNANDHQNTNASPRVAEDINSTATENKTVSTSDEATDQTTTTHSENNNSDHTNNRGTENPFVEEVIPHEPGSNDYTYNPKVLENPNFPNEDKDVQPNNTEVNFVAPLIDDMCAGTLTRIKNENSKELTVIFPNGLIWTGKANASTALYPSLDGVYQLGYMNNKGEFVPQSSFRALPLPKADFEFTETDKPYENGIPTVKVNSNVIGQNFNWKSTVEEKNGKQASFHFFNDGSQDLVLTVTGENGCKASVKKSVVIDNDYNLLAEKAFVPTDLDPANNVFMPDALVERNVNFHMIIIDPSDGHVIFESNNADNGWTGIDKQSGQLVQYEKAYIWKVTVLNPMAGERPVYSGTIVPLQSRH